MWLWHRPAALALIPPLTWEFPYATSAVPKKKKKKKKKKQFLLYCLATSQKRFVAAILKTHYRSSSWLSENKSD